MFERRQILTVRHAAGTAPAAAELGIVAPRAKDCHGKPLAAGQRVRYQTERMMTEGEATIQAVGETVVTTTDWLHNRLPIGLTWFEIVGEAKAGLTTEGTESTEAKIVAAELERKMRNSNKTQNWLKTQKEMDAMKMTPEEKVAAMNKAKEERLKHPVECKDCHEEFLRKSLVAKRCDSCKDKHRREKAQQRAAQSRKAKKNLGAPPTVPTNPTNPPAGSDEELTLLCTCGHPMGRHEFADADHYCLADGCKCEDFTRAGSNVLKDIDDAVKRMAQHPAIPRPQQALKVAAPEARRPPEATATSRYALVPLRALEAAHGQIQTLWKRVADLELALAAKGA